MNAACGYLAGNGSAWELLALLIAPEVLTFYEATSSLDYESERSIQLIVRNISPLALR